MAKRYAVLLLVLLLGLGAYAQDGSSVDTTLGLDGSVSVASGYVSPELTVTYQPRTFGIGGGIKSYFGPVSQDVLLAGYARGTIGAFYMHLGAVFELKEPVSRSNKVPVSISDLDTPVSPLAALGADFGLFEAGSGEFGLDIGLEGYISTLYVDEPEDPGEAIGFALAAPILVVFNFPKLNVGVTYTF
jgi:hypothetical protein